MSPAEIRKHKVELTVAGGPQAGSEEESLWARAFSKAQTFSNRGKKPTYSLIKNVIRSPRCGAAETNPISIHEDGALIPGLVQWVGDLAWLWCRLADVALIRLLAWELPYAAVAALKIRKKKVIKSSFPLFLMLFSEGQNT